MSTTRKLTLTAILTAVAVVGRLLLSPLPNVQPITVLILWVTWNLGMRYGLTIAALSLLISNLFIGMGPWYFAQLAAFIVVLLLGWKLPRVHWLRLGYVALAGFIYGLIADLILAPFYGIKAIIPYLLQGVPYDGFHALGNIAFYILLVPALDYLYQHRLKGGFTDGPQSEDHRAK